MRKIQIEQSTLGPLKSGNKIGNPWHNPRNGEFASGPGAASASLSPTTAIQKDSPREKSDVMNFVVEHRKDAAIIAASLDVPTEMILGLSGAETLWGKGRFAVQGNNFFSLHAGRGLPYQKGSIPYGKNKNMASFGSFLDSGRAFAALYGDAVRGITNPTAFAQALVRARFNPGKSNRGGNNNFVAFTAATIKSAERRLRALP